MNQETLTDTFLGRDPLLGSGRSWRMMQTVAQYLQDPVNGDAKVTVVVRSHGDVDDLRSKLPDEYKDSKAIEYRAVEDGAPESGHIVYDHAARVAILQQYKPFKTLCDIARVADVAYVEQEYSDTGGLVYPMDDVAERVVMAVQHWPDEPGQSLHDAWLGRALLDGWRYAPVENAREKKHPYILPYGYLTQRQQKRDEFFVDLVLAAAKSLGIKYSTVANASFGWLKRVEQCLEE